MCVLLHKGARTAAFAAMRRGQDHNAADMNWLHAMRS